MTTTISAVIERMTPVEIDTFLSKNYQVAGAKRQEYEKDKASAKESLTRIFGRKAEKLDDDPYSRFQMACKRVARLEATAAKFLVELKAIQGEAVPYQSEYARRPWLRYFLVLNSNGHVHREMHCTTCFPTTWYKWLVDLADCDEGRMVKDYGEKACTVCFPDAPTMTEYVLAMQRVAEEENKVCPASGSYSPNGYSRRYLSCPECGVHVAMTSTGKFRKHDRRGT